MKSRVYLATALAAVGLCIAGGGISAWQYLNRPQLNVAAYLSPASRLELMDPETKEWTEKHFPRADGSDESTTVAFRDGNVGTRKYRLDHTLEHIFVVSAQGVPLVDLTFSPEGRMPVSGFERRNDGTLRLQVETNGKVTTTKRFWQDGVTLFSLEEREVDEYMRNITFFRASGVLWSKQYGSIFGSAQAEDLFDEAGALVRSFDNRDYQKPEVFRYFYPGGGERFVQYWEEYQHQEYSEHGSAMVTSRALKHVVLFDEQHRMTRRITLLDGGTTIDQVEDFDVATGYLTGVYKFDLNKVAPVSVNVELVERGHQSPPCYDQWKAAEERVSALIEYRDR